MRLHVVDGTYELFRAHYSHRPDHHGPDGNDLKATVGVVASLLALLDDADEAVTHLAVAFDNPIRSFRNELFSPYKSDEGVPAPLRAQFDEVEAAVRAMGIVVWSMDRFEADDAMATAARRFSTEVEQVRLLTPDKDMGQCLAGSHVVQVDRRMRKVTDEAAFRRERGFAPASMPDFLALVGDVADGIPGLPGFGRKTAAILLGTYAHLEQIPTDAASWPAGIRGAEKLAGSLVDQRAQVLLYRQLATLVADVPLRESLAGLEHAGLPQEPFASWCDRVGAGNLKALAARRHIAGA